MSSTVAMTVPQRLARAAVSYDFRSGPLGIVNGQVAVLETDFSQALTLGYVPVDKILADLAAQGGGSGIEISDGTHTVDGATSLTVTGGTVGGTTPNATLDIFGGGGGSSLTTTLTASTALAAGTGVSVNGSGEGVQTWGPAPNIDGLVSPLGTGYFTSNEFPTLVLSSTLFIVFGGVLNDVGASANTVSGTTITTGALNTNAALKAVAFSAAGPYHTPTAAALSGTSFVIAYNDSGTGNLNVAVCTVSGTTITVGTPVQVDSQAAYGSGGAVSVVKVDASHFAVGYIGADQNAYGVVGSFSGTTITLGTPVELNSGANNSQFVTTSVLASSLLVFTYYNGTAVETRACSLSGTTLTAGTAVTISAMGNGYPSSVPIDSTHVLISGGTGYTNNLAPIELVVGSVSGTTITLGTPVDIAGPPAANGAYLQSLGSGGFVIVAGSNATAPILGSVSGSTITLSPGVPLRVPPGNNDGSSSGVAILSSSSFIFVDGLNSIYQDDDNVISAPIMHDVQGYWLYTLSSSTALATLWNDDGSFVARIISATSAIATPPIGITSGNVSMGGNATVTTFGECAVSGLTAGAAYYYNGDGTLTTADTGHPAGIAKGTGTILVGVGA